MDTTSVLTNRPLAHRSSFLIVPAFALVLLVAFFVSCEVATAGTIGPGTYVLFDHGNGNLGPNYGLRVDAISKVFSTEIGAASALLTWDGGVTANISGILNENTAGGNGGVGPTWTFNYDLTGVSAVGTLGFTATGGAGTLTDPSNVVTNITGETNGSGFAFEFLADGHRITGDNDTPVGRGWLLPPGTTDDWIVRAQLIPEPSAALLMGLGTVGVLLYRRKLTA